MAVDKEEISHWVDQILEGNRYVLSRMITLIESSRTEDRIKAEALLKKLQGRDVANASVIGITGSPGAGKSTLINALGAYCIKQEDKIAVLAIDPSSAQTGGSLLGDKIRMTNLVNEPNAFIRPSPNQNKLGGISPSTFMTLELCKKAGFDYIFVETVGVGQSEITIRLLADVVILVDIAESGDDIQAIKKGTMEIADIIFVNKATSELQGKQKKQQIKEGLMLRLSKSVGDLNERVLMGNPLENEGMDALYRAMTKAIAQSGSSRHMTREQFEDFAGQYILSKLILNQPFSDAMEEIRVTYNGGTQSIFQTQEAIDKLLKNLLP